MPEPCCWGQRTGRSDWSSALRRVLPMGARRNWSSMRSGPWSDSVIFGIALGYEDLVDHDQLRHDRRWRCWPASWRRGARPARRWPANRRSIGWSWAALTRYHRIAWDGAKIEAL